MKRILQYAAAIFALTMLSACSPKLKPLSSELFSLTPNPPEVVGKEVPYSVAVSIPAKWMHKDVSLRITPVLRYSTGEIWGASAMLQGEAVRDNNPVIAYSTGGMRTISGSFLYDPKAAESDLYITFRASRDGKQLPLKPVKLSSGIITTATLADIQTTPAAFAEDRFQRVVTERIDEDIKFLLESSVIRPSEKRKPELIAWKKRVEEAKAAPNQSVSVEVSSYASPEGGVKLNEKLSKHREESTTRLIEKELGKGSTDLPIRATYTAQDWDGFRAYVEASDLPDKELVLRVLSMYSDPEEREREIRNISVVYDRISKEILPQLRRSRITAIIETTGKSDEELTDLLRSNPASLNVEELLYAISLERSEKDRVAYYQRAAQLYPEDSRATNNLAAIAIQQGNLSEADRLLNSIKGTGAESQVRLNRALLLIHEGRLEDAAEEVDKAEASAAKQEVLGLLQLKQGKHNEAASTLKESHSTTAAIAQIMTHNYARAIDLLDNAVPAIALTHYLKAVCYARQNSAAQAATALSEAILLNPSLRSKARSDAEFRNIRNSQAIARLLGR